MSKDKQIVSSLRFPGFQNAENWQAKELGIALDAQSSQIAKNKLELRDIGYPVYGADGLLGFIDYYDKESDYIAIVKDGSSVGNLFFYHGNSSLLSTLQYLISKNQKKYKLKWLYYLLQTIDFSYFIKGSGIPHIYYKDYSKLIIFIPKPQEQQKIADCLSFLDDLITAQDEKLQALKAHKKGLMQKLFPQAGQANPNYRFPEFENAEEWQVKKLGDVAIFLKGKGVVKSDLSVNGNQPCIRYGELYTRYSETIRSIISHTNIPVPELVLSKANDVIIPASGETQEDIARASCVLKNNIALGGDINIIRAELNGIFLSYYLNSVKKQDIAKLSQGVSVIHLYSSQLKTLKINIPRKKEQQKIADCLSSLDELITAQDEKLQALKDHKKGLMQGLFPQVED